MNKLFTKIGVALVGIAMAVGVGVAVGNNNEVKMASALGGTDLTISSYATANSWSNGTAYSSVSYDANVTLSGASGGNNNKYYSSNKSWRHYEGDSGAVTITAGTGYTLSSATFTYSNGNNGVLKYGGENKSSGTKVTLSGSSAVFTVGHSSGSSNGNVQITKINIEYALTAGTKAVTVNISGSLSKTSYKKADSWSNSGLTVSGTYDTSTPYDGSFEWSYSPATPSAMGVGNNQDLTIRATVSTSGFTGYAETTVKVDVTAKNDFSSVIQDGHYYRIYSPIGSTKYYLEENGTSNAKAPTAALTGTVFQFKLVDDNTWTIKNGSNFLYTTSSATSRFGSQEDSWVLANSTATTFDGTYSLKETKNGRFLSLYTSNSEYRSYTDVATNREANIEFEEYTAGKFADDVVASTQSVCDEGCDNAKSDFTDAWTFLTNKYTTLLDADKALLVGATYTRTGSTVTPSGTTTQQIADGVARHDYLVGKYKLDNILTGRIVPSLSKIDATSISADSLSDSSIAIIVVIISSTALLAVGGYFLLRRKHDDK